jgi:signal transduction histidine kinase
VKNSVSDAGNIDTERLFERFFSGDKSRNSESTGLGLAVVKLLVEKLDGEIQAELRSDVLTIEFSLEAVTSTEK